MQIMRGCSQGFLDGSGNNCRVGVHILVYSDIVLVHTSRKPRTPHTAARNDTFKRRLSMLIKLSTIPMRWRRLLAKSSRPSETGTY